MTLSFDRFREPDRERIHQYISSKRHRINAERKERKMDKLDTAGIILFFLVAIVLMYGIVWIGGTYR